MADFLDYIRWRGDITFAEKGLNEVDALILNEMVYLELQDIITDKEEPALTLSDAYHQYCQRGYDQSFQSNDPGKLVEVMVGSKRFCDLKLAYYTKVTDTQKEVQFAALTIFLDNETTYVSFRGTDNSIVGWREDFNLSFQSETAGQALAVEYLNRVMGLTEGSVYVGGHSKGGNLAVYASAFCAENNKKRIVRIYSNDGPGMNKNIAVRQEYITMLDRVELSIPESSVVGILFSNTKKRKIVKSNAFGAGAQHNPYTWQVIGDHFEEVEQSEQSIFMNGTLNQWLDRMDDKQKEEFTRGVFEILEASGARTLAEINADKWVSYNAILKAAWNLDAESQQALKDSLKELALISRDVFWNEAQKAFEKNKM